MTNKVVPLSHEELVDYGRLPHGSVTLSLIASKNFGKPYLPEAICSTSQQMFLTVEKANHSNLVYCWRWKLWAKQHHLSGVVNKKDMRTWLNLPVWTSILDYCRSCLSKMVMQIRRRPPEVIMIRRVTPFNQSPLLLLTLLLRADHVLVRWSCKGLSMQW